jgi:RNA ligase (TIGR02306 family)
MERKLASIRRINEILPIEGADLIEIAVVGGWYVIVKKGEYVANDLAVYFEIDSWIPYELAPFLSNGKEPREYNGVKGERLRSKKMRGVVSQGLLLKTDQLVFAVETKSIGPNSSAVLKIENLDYEGADLTEILGIQKWEKPLPSQLQGVAKGNFPTHICPKTDAERCCDENTMILTCSGLKSIKQICDEKYDGKVLSFNHETNTIEFKKIIGYSVMTRKKDQWFLIKTKSGKEIKVTKNHRIYLPHIKCYREAQNLKIGDIVNILS